MNFTASAGVSTVARRSPVVLALLALVTLYSFLRGQRDGPEWAGEFYYVIDYGDGLIRRGLIGQIFLFFFNRSEAPKIFAVAVLAHRLISIALMFCLLAWCWGQLNAPRRFTPGRLGLIYLCFTAGQFLPTLAATNTYLDAYVFLLLAAAFGLVAAGWEGAAIGLGLLGPFVHEMFVFLWASLAVMVLWRDGIASLKTPARLFLCVCPLLSWALIQHFSSADAVARQLAKAPLSRSITDVALHGQLGQTVGDDLRIMAGLYTVHFTRAVCSIVAFVLPTLAMLGLALAALAPRERAFLAIGSLLPLVIIILEWDLSRFVVVTQFVCLLCVLFMASRPGARVDRPVGRKVWLAASPVLAIALLLPLIYGYFDRTDWVTNAVLDGLPVVGERLRALYPGA